MNPLPPSSLASIHRHETYAEKAQRFNEHAEILTGDRRVFVVQEPRIRSFFAWEQQFIIEMELVEKEEQYNLAFQVTIRWEEIFGHSYPNDKTLYRIARTAMGDYLEKNRYVPCYSTHTRCIRLIVPDPTPPYFP
ncbi:MAG: hypothetical protein KY445_16800 [Armatimonadetes bacterium]|nr:hypothetical protein [Armatimonadota bacterium]